MVDHDLVVPLNRTVEIRRGLEARVEQFELAYRVTGIEDDDIVEFTRDGDVVGDKGTFAQADWNDPQGPLTERQQGVERLGLWSPAKSLAV